jgi:hypothetical protein
MPGAFRTQADLVNQVLENLGALAIGQTPNVEDVASVASEIDSFLRMLAGLDICYVADSNAIPGTIFDPLAAIIAGELANAWGKTGDEFTQLVSRGLGMPPGSGSGAMAIKAIMRGRPTYESLRVQYF